MNYKDLNKIQKDRMKQISVHDYIMEWKNPEFMDYLLGSLPQIRGMKVDESITDELSKLNNMLVSYDSFESDKQSFLAEMDMPKSGDAKQPQCPKDKEKAIEDALRYFQMK